MSYNFAMRAFHCVVLCLAGAFVAASCAPPEDPARAGLRDRLHQAEPLVGEELDRLRAEVTRTMTDQQFLVRDGDRTHALDADRHAVVFGMLTQPIGMFDEGLREEEGHAFRILNAPATSPSSEIDTARRLWIDVETFLPRRFEYTYGFPHPENYTYDIVVQ